MRIVEWLGLFCRYYIFPGQFYWYKLQGANLYHLAVKTLIGTNSCVLMTGGRSKRVPQMGPLEKLQIINCISLVQSKNGFKGVVEYNTLSKKVKQDVLFVTQNKIIRNNFLYFRQIVMAGQKWRHSFLTWPRIQNRSEFQTLN